MTAGQTLVSLSGLSGVSAGAHLMAITAGAGATIFVQHMRVTTTTDRFTISQKPKRDVSQAVERPVSQQGNKGKNVYVSSPVPQYHVLTGPDEIWVRTNKETI